MICGTCKNGTTCLVNGEKCWTCAFPRPEHDNPEHWAAARPKHERKESSE